MLSRRNCCGRHWVASAGETGLHGLPKSLRWLALAVVPRRYHLPLRYHYRRWFHKLEPEFRFLRTLVGNAQTAIDVGGNLGIYTYALSKLCRRVEVFEPVPSYAHLLRQFGAPEVRVHQAALSSRDGVMRLHFAKAGDHPDLGRGTLSARLKFTGWTTSISRTSLS